MPDAANITMQLLSDQVLEQSGVVANCRMNRERGLTGSNGYSKELGFHPLEFLNERVAASGRAAWLDLCCGSGTALIEATQSIHQQSNASRIRIVGIDLVGMFSRAASGAPGLELIEASLSTWRADEPFDLITCIHGLHYIGDKLGLIARALSWLTKEGTFAAHLDFKNVKFDGGTAVGRVLLAELRRNSIVYDRHRRLIVCRGPRSVTFPWRYLGADDQAGPNFTGQPAVNSHYERKPN